MRSTQPPAPAAPPLPPPAHAAPLPRPAPGAGGTRILTGVPFADIPGVRPLECDVVLPPAPADGAVERAWPVVVFLHGGGWRLGSRRTAGPAFTGASPTPFEVLAGAGIAVVSADYRLSGEATWPAQLHDAKAAVRWVRSRAAELGVDADRIGVWGESAGGHLAELVGLTGHEPGGSEAGGSEVRSSDLEGSVGVTGASSAVIAVVAWYAPSDVAAVATDTGADPADATTREALLLGAVPASVPQRAAQASPLAYANTGHVDAGAPPFLLLHGAADRLVPAVQSERLRDALGAAGVDVELELLPGADHMWLGAPDAAARALARTTAFLTARLAAPPTPPAQLSPG